MSEGETPAKDSGDGSKENGKRFEFFDHHMWWIIALSIAGFLMYPIFNQQCFPSASLEIKKPRLEIEEDAKELAGKIGFRKDNVIESTVFDYDYEEKTFLEYKYPLEEANKLMLSEIPVWYWHTRLVKEFDQEQFACWISPKGEMVAFERKLPNDKKMNSISHEEARLKALEYLIGRRGEVAASYKLISDSSDSKPKREDHSFTWEDDSTEYKGAHNRYYVHISGDEVTEFTQYLHVPESFKREYETIRSYNNLLSSCSWLFITLLQVIGSLTCIWALVTKNLRWRPALLGGLIMGSIATIAYVNRFPSLISGYSPEQSFNAYLVSLILPAVWTLLSSFLTGAFLFAGSEIFYRTLFPKAIAMEKLFSWTGLSQKRVLRGVVVGHFLVGIHFGWIMLYYVAGRKLNFWCPLGIDDYKVLSDIAPFFSAIALGVSASFTEELTERVIGLGVGTFLFRNFWLANLFQAVIWGFAHSTYAQQPCYVRGLELTIVGLLQGWILRRYGLAAVITEHYLLDAFLDVESLFKSDVLPLKLSGILALIPASLIPLTAWLLTRNKPPVAPEELANEKIPLLKQDAHLEELATPFQYKPLKKGIRAALVALAAVGVISGIGGDYFEWMKGVGADARLAIDRNTAITKAQAVMRKHDLNPDDWKVSAECTTSSWDLGEQQQYMFEKTNLATVKEKIRKNRHGFRWLIRFFKPLTSEEYRVRLDGAGNEVSLDITREEDDRGASLSQEEARARGEKYLRRTQAQLNELKEKPVDTQKRKNRVDHVVEFRVPEDKIGEAESVVTASVIGDQVGNYSQYWDVPDSWTFERQKRALKDEIFWHVRVITMVICAILFLWWAFTLLKTGAVRWRIPILLALIGLFLNIAQALDQMPTFFSYYRTTEPINSYILQALSGYGQSFISQAAAVIVSWALAIGALRLLAPRAPLHTVLLYAIGKHKPAETIAEGGAAADTESGADDKDGASGPVSMWVDAILLSWGAIAFFMIHGFLLRLVRVSYSPQVTAESIGAVADLSNSFVPLLSVLAKSCEWVGTASATVIIVAGVVAKYAPQRWRLALITVLLILIVNSGDRYWQEYLINVVSMLVVALVAYLFVVTARTNYLAYVLCFFMLFIIIEFHAMLVYAPTLFAPEIIGLSLAMASPLLCLSAIWLRQRLSSSSR